MTPLVPQPSAALPSSSLALPALIVTAGDQAWLRFVEFFSARIRNPNTRRAYGRSVSAFLAWCADHGVADLARITPLHVATWIELLGRALSAPQRETGARGPASSV